MPPNPAPHLTDWLIELGIAESGGMAATPLTHGEIRAWRENTGVRIEPWEARLLRSLSAAYVTESRKAESENCPQPWRPPAISARERDVSEAELRSVLG